MHKRKTSLYIQKNPLVSIYVPTYNRLELLKRALKSIQDQDYKNIEVLVVDDGSSDGTVDYLEELCGADSRFSFLVNNKNLGACASRNKAIFTARGEFITGLDDDDYYMPNRISSFVSDWPADDRIKALYSDSIFILKNFKTKKTNRPSLITQKDLIITNKVGNQVFTKTSTLREAGGFDINFPAWQDLECWYRLLSSKNSTLKKTHVTTYVVDQSHPHERISNGRIQKINESCSLFIKTHNLNKIESIRIKSQTIPYYPTPPSIAKIIKYGFGSLSIETTTRLAKYYIGSLSKKHKTN